MSDETSDPSSDLVERVRRALADIDAEALRELKRNRERWARERAQRFRSRKHRRTSQKLGDA